MKKSKLNQIWSGSWMNSITDCNFTKWTFSLTDSHVCDVFKTNILNENIWIKKSKNHYLSQDFLLLHTNSSAHISRFFIKKKHSASTDRISSVVLDGISKISIFHESYIWYPGPCKRSKLVNKGQKRKTLLEDII